LNAFCVMFEVIFMYCFFRHGARTFQTQFFLIYSWALFLTGCDSNNCFASKIIIIRHCTSKTDKPILPVMPLNLKF
jgi:hypothetical protein